MIAQLNDMAYRGIKKAGKQKKLDERVIKNESFFKKIDAQVKKLAKKVNVEKLEAEHKQIVDLIGPCPLSTNTVVEAMAEADCMCIGL